MAGFLLGMRHALDADHVAAISTLVSRHRSLLRSCVLGTFWGVGHTAALLGAALVMIAFKLTVMPVTEKAFEAVVALMLIALGGRVLLRSVGHFQIHRHEHAHGGGHHAHVHAHISGDSEHDHVHVLRMGSKPLLVGVVHGLAGSAALTLLVLSTLPSTASAIVYILVFGLGSTIGMLILSGVIGIPFALSASRSSLAHALVQALAGAATLVLGVVLLAAFSSLR
jgi:high-affinity nickel permease